MKAFNLAQNHPSKPKRVTLAFKSRVCDINHDLINIASILKIQCAILRSSSYRALISFSWYVFFMGQDCNNRITKGISVHSKETKEKRNKMFLLFDCQSFKDTLSGYFDKCLKAKSLRWQSSYSSAKLKYVVIWSCLSISTEFYSGSAVTIIYFFNLNLR